MNQNSKLLPAILIVGIFALVFGFSGYLIKSNMTGEIDENAGGGNSYNQYGNASSTTFADSKIYQLKTGQSVLGSIIIASSSAISFKVKNATSTTDIASTTIAIFPAAADEGTYGPYNLSADRGLIIESSSGFNGDIAITYE